MAAPVDADILVIGGGPVGLYAALKAAILNHRVVVVDKGRRFSRVVQAATIASIPGLSGVSGPALLDALRRDLLGFRDLRRAMERGASPPAGEDLAGKDLVEVHDDTEAFAARREPGGFAVDVRPTAGGPARTLRAPVVVLATGVVDRKPGVSAFDAKGHATMLPWARRGAIGYCILCEGWAVERKRVCVVGAGRAAESIAGDLREHFEAEVDLVDPDDLVAVEGVEGAVDVTDRDGTRRYDKAFFSLGWYRVNNALAALLGAKLDEHGYVVTNADGEVLDAEGVAIRGLFAVGDVRADRWKQIVVGWGDADTAVIQAYAYRLPTTKERKEEARARRA